jgi:chemotaxis protein methyltransferase CheR
MIQAAFDYIAAFIKRRSGIVLAPDKTYLVECRLLPLARQQGLDGLPAIVAGLRRGDATLQRLVVEAMTTNETLFFRDRLPFEQCERLILPQLISNCPPGATIRIWCAACSSGQEPYSLAMLIEECGFAAQARFEIIGTDISEAMIARATEGLYTQFEVQRGLAVRHLMQWFAQEGTHWRIAPRLRQRITFTPLNLLDDFSGLGRFDLIFCRNLLIYFDQATRATLLDRLAAALTPGGFLLLGAAEAPDRLSDALARHRDEPSLIVRTDNPASARPARPLAGVED